MLRDKRLLAVSLVVFATYAGAYMIVPVRVLYAQAHGASLVIIGAMATSFLLSNFIFQYPVGWLADRWGRKRVMTVGVIAQIVVSLGYLLITDPVMFVALRLIEGAASATILSPSRALVADISPPDKRGEAYGVFNSFFNASLLLGPAIGGLLASIDYSLVFVGAFAIRLVALAIMLLLVQVGGPRPLAEGQERRTVSLRELLTLPLLGAYVLTFGDYLYLGFDQTIFPLWMHDNLGASVALIGLTYICWGIPNTILSPVGGRLADRMRRSSLILAFGAAQVPLYMAYGLLSFAWPMIVLSLVHGAIYALMQPAVDAHLAASSLEEARARVQAFYASVGLAGAFVGANGFSVLYQANYRFPLFALGGAFGLCVLVGGLMVRRSESRGLVALPHPEPEPARATA
jgi:MFS family permease